MCRLMRVCFVVLWGMSATAAWVGAIEIDDVEAAKNEMGGLRQSLAKAGVILKLEEPLRDTAGYVRAADLASSLRVLLEAWVNYHFHPYHGNNIFRSVFDQVVFLVDQVGLDDVDLGEGGYDGLLTDLNVRLTDAAPVIYDELLPAVRGYAVAVQAGAEMAGPEAQLRVAVIALRDAFFMMVNEDEESDEEETSDEESDEEESDEEDSSSEESESDEESGSEDNSEDTTDTASYSSSESDSSSESESEGDEDTSSSHDYQTASDGYCTAEEPDGYPSDTGSVVYYRTSDEENSKEESESDEETDRGGATPNDDIDEWIKNLVNNGDEYLVITSYDDEDSDEEALATSRNSTDTPSRVRRSHSAERFWTPGDWGIILTRRFHSGYKSE